MMTGASLRTQWKVLDKHVHAAWCGWQFAVTEDSKVAGTTPCRSIHLLHYKDKHHV